VKFQGGRSGIIRSKRSSSLIDQDFQPLQVEFAVVHSKEISRWAPHQALRVTFLVQCLSQARDVGVQSLSGTRRRRIPPQSVHQAVARDDLVAMEQQHCQSGSLLGAAERKDPPSVSDLKRA
jgi:hypothetical protein